nr:MAG TPA: hypothetical protein [Caudoviricetes sp.]
MGFNNNKEYRRGVGVDHASAVFARAHGRRHHHRKTFPPMTRVSGSPHDVQPPKLYIFLLLSRAGHRYFMRLP